MSRICRGSGRDANDRKSKEWKVIYKARASSGAKSECCTASAQKSQYNEAVEGA